MTACACNGSILVSMVAYTITVGDGSDSRLSRRRIVLPRQEWENSGVKVTATIVGNLIKAWDTVDIALSWKLLVFVTAFCTECRSMHSFNMVEFDQKEVCTALDTPATAFKVAQHVQTILLQILDTQPILDGALLELAQMPDPD